MKKRLLNNNKYYKITLRKRKRYDKSVAFERSNRYTRNQLALDAKCHSYKNCFVTIKLQKEFFKFIKSELTQDERNTLVIALEDSIGIVKKFKSRNNFVAQSILDEQDAMLDDIFQDIVSRYEYEDFRTYHADEDEIILNISELNSLANNATYSVEHLKFS